MRSKPAEPISVDRFHQLIPVVDRQAIEVVLGLMPVPESLACLGTVATNLRNASKWFQVVDPGFEAYWGALVQVADALQTSFPQGGNIHAFFGSVDDNPRPLSKIIERFPVYALFARRAPAWVKDSYWAAIAITLVCRRRFQFFVKKGFAAEEDFNGRLQGSARKLRLLQESESLMLPPPTQLGAYLDSLSAANDTDHPLYPFNLLLQSAEKREIPGMRFTHSHQRIPKPMTTWQPQENDEDDPSSRKLSIGRCRYTVEEEEREAIEEGCAPGEAYGVVTYIEEEEIGEETLPGQEGVIEASIAAKYVRAKRKREHVVRAAQHLPRRWERLQLADSESFLKELDSLYRKGKKNGVSEQGVDKELALLMRIVYWLSRPIEKVVNLILVSDVSRFPQQCANDELYYALAEKIWCLHGLSPLIKGGDEVQKSGQARRISGLTYLPDCAGIGDWFVERRPHQGQRVFAKPLDLYIRAAKAWIKHSLKYSERFTLNRIENTIFWSLTEDTSDIAHAVLALCHPHTDAGTFLHYYAPSQESLWRSYANTCERFSTAGLQIRTFDPPAELTVHHVGTPLCPTAATVRNFVSAMQADCRDKFSSVRSPTFICDAHNALVIYVASMLGYVTGYRSVVDPMGSLDEIDLAERRATIADKTNDKDYGTRLSILTDLLCRQLEKYNEHLNALQLHLAILNTHTHRRVMLTLDASRRTDHRSGALEWGAGNNDIEIEPAPYLFLLDKELQIVQLRPGTMKPYLNGLGFSMPTNSNRHYLRTRLREEGVMAEHVAVVLGHWKTGQEPYDSFASIGLDDIEDEVIPILERMMVVDGWKIMPGLGE